MEDSWAPPPEVLDAWQDVDLMLLGFPKVAKIWFFKCESADICIWQVSTYCPGQAQSIQGLGLCPHAPHLLALL